MKLFWRLRVSVKRLAARCFLLIEFCKRCGIRQPIVWTAPDDLWRDLWRKYRYNVLCERCFDDLAMESGHRLRWIPIEERFGLPAVGVNELSGLARGLCELKAGHSKPIEVIRQELNQRRVH
jgi:hypothetical protein